jgi:hypothetical protein
MSATCRRAAIPLALSLLVATPVRSQQFGSATLHGALVWSATPSDGTPRLGARADLGFVLGRFGLGPEVGAYFTGPAAEGASGRRGENVVTVGGVARYRLGSGTIVPYLVVGFGSYTWESARQGYPTGTYFSGSAGLGLLRWLRGRTIGLSAEARLHQLLQSTGLTSGRRFVAVTAGVTFGW